ncbi:MAG: hypothetical protein JWQ27_2896 [Ferruginibacter sp.]|nr:hypothetical protein [Ferruginibacter sp.]
MKNKILVATAAAAGAALITAFVKHVNRRKATAAPVAQPKSHHLTNVFSHAKQNVV